VITALACSLVGQQQSVRLLPGTRAAALYGAVSAVEDYYCNYGVNPDYVARLQAGGLRVSGVGDEGELRIVELPDHPFFMATLFRPRPARPARHRIRSCKATPPPSAAAASLGPRLARRRSTPGSPRPPAARRTPAKDC